MTNSNFLGWAVLQLLESGVTIKFLQQSVSEGYIGWFDGYKKQMLVCVSRVDFLSIFLHEFCHFLQWRDNNAWWAKHMKKYIAFSNWISRASSKKATSSSYIAMELDCERRAVELVKKFKLSIDIPQYIKKANACLFLYHIVEKNRGWPENKKPSVFSDEIVSKQASKFLAPSDYRKLSKMPKAMRTYLTGPK